MNMKPLSPKPYKVIPKRNYLGGLWVNRNRTETLKALAEALRSSHQTTGHSLVTRYLSLRVSGSFPLLPAVSQKPGGGSKP